MRHTFIALAAALLTFAACEPDNTIITPKDDEEPESPITGEDPSTEGYIMLDKVSCTNYGDYYENGTTNIFFDFFKDAVYDSDGGLVCGTEVCIDLLLGPDASSISSGEFRIDDSQSANTIVSSIIITDEDAVNDMAELFGITAEEVIELFWSENYDPDGIYDLEGSSIWSCSSADEDFEPTVITGGSVKFNVDGTSVTILMDIETAGGAVVKYSYEGDLTIEEYVPGEDEDDDPDDDVEDLGDVTFNPVTVYAYNMGEDYGTMDKAYYDWCLFMYDEDEENGDMVELDFFSDQSLASNVLPTGTFKIKDDGQYYIYEPGCAVPFYYDEEDNYGYGCYYAHEGYYWYCATDGEMTISKNGSTYTIEYSMYDAESDETFSGKYSGPVTISDQSAEYSAANVQRRQSCASSGMRNASKNGKHLNNEKVSYNTGSRHSCNRR